MAQQRAAKAAQRAACDGESRAARMIAQDSAAARGAVRGVSAARRGGSRTDGEPR
jgi:hypothetical protein